MATTTIHGKRLALGGEGELLVDGQKLATDGGSASVAWNDITGKPSTFAPTIGTTAATAKAGNYTPTSAEVGNALKAKAQIAALVSPTADYADLTAATAAIKSIIDALKA